LRSAEAPAVAAAAALPARCTVRAARDCAAEVAAAAAMPSSACPPRPPPVAAELRPLLFAAMPVVADALFEGGPPFADAGRLL
jgi:hypothetical protein